MATLNELGRNSASVTYGPYANGQDLFPTVQAVDTWYRNDTWQGTAYGASGQATLTGIGTIWNTQAIVAQNIWVGGQYNSVLSIGGDTAITLNSNLTSAITSGSPARVIAISGTQPKQVSGYLSTFVRGSTNGTVSVTNNSSTITGTGTYFLSEATNSIATTAMTGTIAIDTSGVITGTSTVFSTGAPTNNSLYPGDSIVVTQTNGAVYYFEIATLPSSDTACTVTVAPSVAITSGSTIAKATNGTIGRSIQINGRMRTIASIASNTSMTVNYPMDFTDTNLRYKVYPRGTISNATAATAGTLYGASSATSAGTTTLTINTVAGAAILQPATVITSAVSTPISAANLPAGTFIVNQQYAASGTTTANNTSVAGTSATNVLTTSGTQTGTIAVGHLVTGNGAAISGVPAGTYVVGITGTTPNFTVTLSQNLTGTVSGQVYFAVGGGTGAYTTNVATTMTTAPILYSSVLITGNWYWDLGYNNLTSTTNTPYMYQTSALDNIWIGDEVRTINFSTFDGTLPASTSATWGTLSDYAGYSGTAVGVLRQTVFGLTFKREDSYLNGNPYGTLTAFTNDFRVGDDIIIDGTECTVTQVVSDSQIKVNIDFTHDTAPSTASATGTASSSATTTTTYSSGGAAGATTITMTGNTGVLQGQLITGTGIQQGTYVVSIATNTFTISKALLVQAAGTYSFYNGTNIWKKLKLHGYSLEGTREGGVGLAGAAAVVTGTVTSSGTSITVSALAAGTGTIILPGMQVAQTSVSGTTLPGLVYIVNQTIATSASITFTTVASTTASSQNAIVFTVNPSTVLVGMIIQNATSTAFSYGPASTYVIGVNNTTFTVYLSNNLTSSIAASQALYFAPSGGNGTYTTNVTTTLSTTATSFYTATTGKFTQAISMLATAGTSYPIGTQQITLSANPTQGQYNFIKISGAGGPSQVLTGTATYSTTIVYGTNTLFTTQLHIGAEIIVGGQYLSVVSITSDTQLIVAQNSGALGVTPVALPSPVYRSVPLYTYITSVSGAVVNLATPIKNNLYSNGANPPSVYLPSTGADFLEYVYSAPNTYAESGTTTLLNTSLDRKYVAFRYWPLYQSTNAALTNTANLATAQGAYATPVYERWTAGYAQTHGVGINQADLSGGTMVWGNLATTTSMVVRNPVCGSATLQMGVQGLATGYPAAISAVTNTMGLANATYTIATVVAQTTDSPIALSLYGVYDITCTTQTSGGTIFLFGHKRYFALQGRSAGNVQTQWVGCIEFERAQPEDLGTGTVAGTGVTFGGTNYGGAQLAAGASPPTIILPGFSQVLQYVSGVAPYPTYAYFNGNRMPTGSQQIPTLPQLGTAAYPIHGCVLACPRVRNSVSDLVGFNAHIYSALTITTGRWGHQFEFGNYGGSYNPAYLNTNLTPTGTLFPTLANSIPQVHMGQIVPVYTNIYNAKRFMFSPVVVLGPAYDPDVRGRLYGLKVLPSGLGTLMDTVSITVDTTTFFYNASAPSASDHWVIGSPPAMTPVTAYPGQQTVVTNRITLTANTPSIQQSWRSLEDTTSNGTNIGSLTTNNFRFALPA